MPNFRERRFRYLEGGFPHKRTNIAACNFGDFLWQNILYIKNYYYPIVLIEREFIEKHRNTSVFRCGNNNSEEKQKKIILW